MTKAGLPTRAAAPRIVSLLPSATELVVAAGRGGALVGRSHECDFPPSWRRFRSARPPSWSEA